MSTEKTMLAVEEELQEINDRMPERTEGLVATKEILDVLRQDKTVDIKELQEAQDQIPVKMVIQVEAERIMDALAQKVEVPDSTRVSGRADGDLEASDGRAGPGEGGEFTELMQETLFLIVCY